MEKRTQRRTVNNDNKISPVNRSKGGLIKFLKNHGKILCFEAFWNDQTYGGGENIFKIKYYLDEDKLEILEDRQPNNGKYSFPKFLKKSKLPKDQIRSFNPGQSDHQGHFYQAEDFIIGQTINVYNREFLLIDCDQVTKEYYQNTYGIKQDKIEMKKQKEISKSKIIVYPPHNGIGSEEDSLGSCINLIPRPPKDNLAKKFIFNRVVLRFLCRKISSEQIDQERQFHLSFYCANDSLAIFVQSNRNSGIINGKYLEKSAYKNDQNGQYYKMSDLYVGLTMNINRQKFQIISADQFTLNFIFQKPDLFPLCDPQIHLNSVRKTLKSKCDLNYIKNLLDQIDGETAGYSQIYEIFL